ncbi:hypothetical protein CGRA01v4_09270 [Colletotrichum graminicola]|nr:hypothetical protein CGRA01v4_09270 [Colletotrichum graminicola]
MKITALALTALLSQGALAVAMPGFGLGSSSKSQNSPSTSGRQRWKCRSVTGFFTDYEDTEDTCKHTKVRCIWMAQDEECYCDSLAQKAAFESHSRYKPVCKLVS